MERISNPIHKCVLEGIRYPDGKIYVGKLLFEDGRVFDGTVSEGIEPIKGKMSFPNGSHYDGTFTGGWYDDDTGIQTYKNGDVYEGSFFQGRKKKGTMTYAGGYSYRGTWQNEHWNIGILTVNGYDITVNKETKREKRSAIDK